jgi:dolichyl-phosphate-mannose--protein O-mannosyl transferase
MAYLSLRGNLPEMSLDSIPWILVAVLVIVVLLAVVMVVVVRERKQPRRLDYRNYFAMGVVWLATGIFLSLLPWLLHEEMPFIMGSFFLVMGLGCTIVGLLNRDKWGKQVEMSATRSMKLTIIIFGALVLLGLVAFTLFMLL